MIELSQVLICIPGVIGPCDMGDWWCMDETDGGFCSTDNG
jgi:hypothetical protein